MKTKEREPECVEPGKPNQSDTILRESLQPGMQRDQQQNETLEYQSITSAEPTHHSGPREATVETKTEYEGQK